MTTISSILPLNAYYLPVQTTGRAIASSDTPLLSSTVVSLSAEAQLLGALNGDQLAASSDNPVSLFNSIADAGTLTSDFPTGVNSQGGGQFESTSSILASLMQTSLESGIYSASGILADILPSSMTGEWLSLLQAEPALASVAIAATLNEGLVGNLISAFA